MQFSTVTLFAAAAALVAADVTVTEESSTLVTITSCAPDVTNCPARETTAAVSVSSASNYTIPANVTSYEGAAAKPFVAGAAAIAAGALLAL